MSRLVFIHIPKGSGSSQREALYKIYGRSNVFWFGVDCDSNEECYRDGMFGGKRVVGGHKGLAFYPHKQRQLFYSFVRDPIDRAVSFFNYCTRPDSSVGKTDNARLAAYEHWMELGVKPQSMLRSIKECDEFRSQIENTQCMYLSEGGRSFEGALQALYKYEFLVGCADTPAVLNEHLGKALGWGEFQQFDINKSTAHSRSEVLSEPGLEDLLREINKEDAALYDYVRGLPDSIHDSSKSLEDHKSFLPVTAQVAGPDSRNIWSRVFLFCKGGARLSEDGKLSLILAVVNKSAHSIDHFDRGVMLKCVGKNADQEQVFSHIVPIPEKAIVEAGGTLITPLELDCNYDKVKACEWLELSLLISAALDVAQLSPLHKCTIQLF